ncbi:MULTISPECIES: transporter substrate-binding domain-containing protein [Methylobacterium]|uniref:transporter substrate-binding domain-containing protein n=1 Tax=Methylobacterium TaxID=407 RepID=UPI0013EAFDB2|nr:transporter substrate-binding domain-containing protein [Methylobacterium sp. DB0501]NGM38143.1 transporter substrate-binding domain-containing protein [Methylobacterium sp. DB0501]
MSDPSRHGATPLDPASREPLRIAINLANAALVQVGGHDGEPHGIAVDLGRALGEWLARPVRLVSFPSAGALMASVGDGGWDVAFIAVDPARTDRVAYSRPYLSIEGVFAVREASPFRSGDDVDRPQVRVASASGAAYHGHLVRSLRHAALVAMPTPGDALHRLREGECDVAAGVRQAVASFAARHGDVRVLPGRFTTIDQAIAVPLHGNITVRSLDECLDRLTGSGDLDRLLMKNGHGAGG